MFNSLIVKFRDWYNSHDCGNHKKVICCDLKLLNDDVYNITTINVYNITSIKYKCEKCNKEWEE